MVRLGGGRVARKGYLRYGGEDGGRFEAWREWTWSWNDRYDATFVDVDCDYACYKCKTPLALIELAARGPKPTTVLRALAKRANCAALLVQFDVEDKHPANAECTWVHPHYGNIGDMNKLQELLLRLRKEHVCEF